MHPLKRAIAARLETHVKEGGNALPCLCHRVYQGLIYIRRLNR